MLPSRNWVGPDALGLMSKSKISVSSHLRTARILQKAKASSQVQTPTLDDDQACSTLSQRFHLTEREVEVLRWVACGKTNRDIGLILNLSPRTVNKHLEHV
jgi:DNA-binding CsgD family transcriptional regulator